jgi:molybdopterin converting factor small subunit
VSGCCGKKLTVRVRFFAPYRRLFGGKERLLDLDAGTTAAGLLEILGDSPERREALFENPAGSGPPALKPHLIVMMNGEELSSRGGPAAELRDGDTIAVLPLMGGG